MTGEHKIPFELRKTFSSRLPQKKSKSTNVGRTVPTLRKPRRVGQPALYSVRGWLGQPATGNNGESASEKDDKSQLTAIEVEAAANAKQAEQNKLTVVHNADGTTTTILNSATHSVTKDSNGTRISTDTYTTTVQTLNDHSEIKETTSFSETLTFSVGANGRAKWDLATSINSVDSLSPLATNLQAAGKRPLDHTAIDWLNDIPMAGKFLKRAAVAFGIDFTYHDVVGGAAAVAPYYCPSPTGCGPIH